MLYRGTDLHIVCIHPSLSPMSCIGNISEKNFWLLLTCFMMVQQTTVVSATSFVSLLRRIQLHHLLVLPCTSQRCHEIFELLLGLQVRFQVGLVESGFLRSVTNHDYGKQYLLIISWSSETDQLTPIRKFYWCKPILAIVSFTFMLQIQIWTAINIF